MPQLKPCGSTMDLAEVQSLHDHPTLRPLYAQRAALRARLDGVHEDITAVRGSIYQLDVRPHVPLPIKTRRDTQQRLDALLMEEEAIQAEQQLLTEQLDVATRQVRVQLQPSMDQQKLAVLEEALGAMEALSLAQANMQALDRRAWSFGIGSTMLGLLDQFLLYRIKRTKETIATLRARQG